MQRTKLVQLVYIPLSVSIFTTDNKKTLIDVSHVSKRGSSLRITLPKKVSEKLGIEPEDILGYYSDGNVIVLEKMK